MNFGPLMPQEIDRMITFLQEKQVPFEIHFNEQESKEALTSENIDNNMGLAEWRTRSYLGQYFYIDIPDEYIINHPELEREIISFITKDKIENLLRTEDDNIIPIHEEKQMQTRSQKIIWLRRIVAGIFLASMIWGLIETLRH